jgi:hypothetical protein
MIPAVSRRIQTSVSLCVDREVHTDELFLMKIVMFNDACVGRAHLQRVCNCNHRDVEVSGSCHDPQTN